MPLTKDDLDAVKALAKAGRIEEARRLLAGIDGDRARAALGKFNERYPETKVSTAAINTPKSFVIGATILLMVIVVVIGMMAIADTSRKSEESMNTGGTRAANDSLAVALEIICRQKFYDGVISKSYTEAELKAGCHVSIQNTLNVWPDEISYCTQRYETYETRFSECLETQQVVILRSYVIQARDNPELLQTPGQMPTLDWDVLTEFPGG